VTAAELLVKAAVIEGRWGSSSPFFGPERRGAPVVAFARISDAPVRLHSQIRHPDSVIVLDEKLPMIVDVKHGLKNGGLLLLNLKEPVVGGPYRMCWVDATSIALKLDLVMGGWPIVNTAMVGAFSKVSGLVKISSVTHAIESTWRGKAAELNAQAALEAYEKVMVC